MAFKDKLWVRRLNRPPCCQRRPLENLLSLFLTPVLAARGPKPRGPRSLTRPTLLPALLDPFLLKEKRLGLGPGQPSAIGAREVREPGSPGRDPL